MHRDQDGAANDTLPTEPDVADAGGDPPRLDPRLTTGIRSILIATDASDVAANAMRVGLALRDELDARAEVVSVLPSRPSPVAPINPGFVAVPTDVDDHARRDRRLAEVLAQVERVRGPDAEPSVTVHVGDPAHFIIRTALDHGAQLIALGLRRHGALDRMFRDETALRVMRQSPVAVLAVTPTLAAAPRRILVGMDFSRASLRVARTAAELLPAGGTLLVAHVQPDAGPTSSDREGAELVYSRGVAASFARLRHDLAVAPNVRIEPVVLRGPADAELLSLAGRSAADVIAVGSHRRAGVDRLLLGSVTAAIARDARCSMLVVGEVGVRKY